MKFSGLSQDFGGWREGWREPIEAVVSKFAEHGFDGIELSVGTPRLPAWDIKKAKKIKELCDSKGLEISNLAPQTFFVTHGGVNNTMKELLNVRACCEMASAIDAPYVRVQLIAYTFTWLPKLEGRPPISLDSQYSQGVSTLIQAVKIAEDIGVPLGLDNHFSLTVMDHLRIVKEINSPNLKLFLDTRNAIDNGEDLIATTRACGKLLVHSHVKDALKGVGGELQRAQFTYADTGELSNVIGVPIGDGNVTDWKAYLRALKDIGYRGFLSIEGAHVSPMYGPFECAERGMKYLRKINKEIGL